MSSQRHESLVIGAVHEAQWSTRQRVWVGRHDRADKAYSTAPRGRGQVEGAAQRPDSSTQHVMH